MQIACKCDRAFPQLVSSAPRVNNIVSTSGRTFHFAYTITGSPLGGRRGLPFSEGHQPPTG